MNQPNLEITVESQNYRAALQEMKERIQFKIWNSLKDEQKFSEPGEFLYRIYGYKKVSVNITTFRNQIREV